MPFSFFALSQWQLSFCVHSMHLGQKISDVEIAFLTAWRRGCSLILYSLAYWRNNMQISTHGSFDLSTPGVLYPSTLAYT